MRSIQCGAALGNGRTGLLLWGGGRTLNVTLGCADLWDHRGHREWNDRMNFRDLRAALETGELQNVRKLLETPGVNLKFGASIIPLGRVVVTLPEGCELLRFDLDFTSGIATLFYGCGDAVGTFEFAADMTMQDIGACRDLPEGTDVELIPAYQLSLGNGAASLKEARNFEPPRIFTLEDGAAFTQELPDDPSCSVLCRRHHRGFTVSMRRGETEISSWQTVPAEHIFASSEKWFREYFAGVPSVECGDWELDEIYWHGMYRYGIATNPAGVSPGLQGPWIEDDSLPPWAGDYHFNINVQLCNS
ncbi:MAG: hypothetical protein J6S21_00050, partial [Victivallales bacterium]|nr:hypothetical protein [Victivallales bacterium]